MNINQEHINTKNFVSIKEDYFKHVIQPVFTNINNTIIPIKKFYSIANKNICINFYGELIAKNLSIAISHNEIFNPNSIDLTINLWDSVSTKTDLISPWSNSSYIFKDDENYRNNYSDLFFGVYLSGEHSISIYDKTNKTAYFWIFDINKIPGWVFGAPVRTILHWFLAESNSHLIHGAVIGLNNKTVLLAAKGGSGKSTTSLACILSGMQYLSDDYAVIKLSDESNEVEVHSLYNSAKLVPSHLDAFPELKDKVWNKDNLDTEKAIIFLSELFPEQITNKSKLQAIMIPVIKDIEKTRIIPANKMQAMLAIIPTTLFQLPLTEVRKIQALKEIVSKVPCYFLELSPNIKEIPDIIKSFLNNSDISS